MLGRRPADVAALSAESAAIAGYWKAYVNFLGCQIAACDFLTLMIPAMPIL